MALHASSEAKRCRSITDINIDAVELDNGGNCPNKYQTSAPSTVSF